MDDRRAVIAKAQEILRKVKTNAREPARLVQRGRTHEHLVKSTRSANAAEFPHQLPESVRMAYREFLQRRIATDVVIAGLLSHEAHEAADVGAFDTLAAG